MPAELVHPSGPDDTPALAAVMCRRAHKLWRSIGLARSRVMTEDMVLRLLRESNRNRIDCSSTAVVDTWLVALARLSKQGRPSESVSSTSGDKIR